LTGIVGACDFATFIVVYHVRHPALSDFWFSEFISAHRVVAGGFFLVALLLQF
jgi:hypothetical protein